LRPARAEGDELVEGVPGEARRTARLRVTHGALGIRRGGRNEEEARDHEDERRQSEREGRRQPERVVDRAANVPVRGREERRRAEDALEPVLLAASAARDVPVSARGRGGHAPNVDRYRSRPAQDRRLRPQETL